MNCATILVRIVELIGNHYQSVQCLFLSNNKRYLVQKDALLGSLQHYKLSYFTSSFGKSHEANRYFPACHNIKVVVGF